jgi:hypothetical protein
MQSITSAAAHRAIFKQLLFMIAVVRMSDKQFAQLRRQGIDRFAINRVVVEIRQTLRR